MSSRRPQLSSHTPASETARDHAPDGLLIVDKPADWTSHDVVGRVRRLARTRKVGHAGTLDPMATGVLVVGIGRATKLLTFLVGCDKDYETTIRLGQGTHTDDREGEVISGGPARALRPDQIESVVATLRGEIEQVPSAVSAIKVDGVRAYARVRGGEEVALAARRVSVSRFVVLQQSIPPDAVDCLDLAVAVTVSSGTYVRALARDLGATLGVGGHLRSLRRTRVGAFTLEHAHGIEDLTAAREAGAELPVIPLATAASAALTTRHLTEQEARALSYGQRIDSLEPGRHRPVAALGPAGTLVAILDESRPTARSVVVFAPATS